MERIQIMLFDIRIVLYNIKLVLCNVLIALYRAAALYLLKKSIGKTRFGAEEYINEYLISFNCFNYENQSSST